MPKYLQLTVELPEGASELAQLALHENGALGVEVRDSQSPCLPGVRGPGPGEALLLGSFDSETRADAAQRAVTRAAPLARIQLETLEDRDWSSAWKDLIRAVEVGRLWVGPPWLVEGAAAGKVRVVVEPKRAFGTGDHPTTRLCLAAVDEYLAAHPHASVLDVGTGTGVLAIAASKLGATRVVGIDNDPVSVDLARECAELNGAQVELSGASLPRVKGRFDLVVANILANTLVELAPRIAAKVTDRLVL
ncbi:MAG TPA: 50S ribosomal protein L11 methyltransferase, partial [Myxococcaceae bacterium]|nr:50S ribosomal protein L11 methyltransferase [Myxococcaceae bacterium]